MAGVFEIPQYSYIPYFKLDLNIVSSVRALDGFSGITTVNSCGGHQDAAPGQNKQGTWRINFEVSPDEDGCFAREFIAWLVQDRIRGKSSIRLRADSTPPNLNRPGAFLSLVLEGWDLEGWDLKGWDLEGWDNEDEVYPTHYLSGEGKPGAADKRLEVPVQPSQAARPTRIGGV